MLSSCRIYELNFVAGVYVQEKAQCVQSWILSIISDIHWGSWKGSSWISGGHCTWHSWMLSCMSGKSIQNPGAGNDALMKEVWGNGEELWGELSGSDIGAWHSQNSRTEERTWWHMCGADRDVQKQDRWPRSRPARIDGHLISEKGVKALHCNKQCWKKCQKHNKTRHIQPFTKTVYVLKFLK